MEKTIIFVADLLPTHVHLPLPWVMGYDMRPIETLTEKERFLKQAASDNWHLFLQHDLDEEVIQITEESGKYQISKKLTLSDL
ncbi:MAG: hypothetical protein BalsKO_20090 [Balneolaceae bacterium]